MKKTPNTPKSTADLRRRAEARLREKRGEQSIQGQRSKNSTHPQRLHHELQVHEIELEMQNVELQESRDRMEALLDKYTDLYDFAPVGYFSLDEQGRILDLNLTGAAMLGVERSRLMNGLLPRFLAPASQPDFLAFLQRVFAGTGKQICEVQLLKRDAASSWASIHGVCAISINGPRRWCRVSVSDITSLKQVEEARRRTEALAVANRDLRREIVRRQAVEESLKKSDRHQSHLLEQLRHLSRQVLRAQEEERKRISRELHDVIAQTLTGINVRLANLKKEAEVNIKGLNRSITRTQRLVEKSVDVVHRFARELRPAVLDDLGLVPALRAYMKSFKEETGIHVNLSAFAAVEQVNGDKRTVLYRCAQEALANVARHAKANRVDVVIQKLDHAVCMKIKDNGRGFTAERVLHAGKSKRLGLLGMKERLEMVGGSFAITSAPGKGTAIQAQIPLEDVRAVEGRKTR